MSEITLVCPDCGRPLVIRTNRHNDSRFLGCTGYPDHCVYTAAVPEHIKMRELGAQPLPGFGA